jgi:hypothetical protein
LENEKINAFEVSVRSPQISLVSGPHVFVGPARPPRRKVLRVQCVQCEEDFRHVLRPQNSQKQPTIEVAAVRIANLPESVPLWAEHRIRFNNFDDLKSSARDCSMCSLT